MARSNGPFGPAGTRPPARRHPADDPYAPPPTGEPNGQWPGPGQGGQQQGQGYHFPPEPDPNYGYNQQQQAPAASFDRYPGPPSGAQPQQWGQQQPDPRGYDLGNYMPNGAQPYAPVDPAQFQQGRDQGAYSTPEQGYAETDADYEDEFVDDEPRPGRRWSLIAVALVGAIGVGGVLAYTYKSFIAPSSGRVPVVKAGDPNVKIKPENRGGKEFPNADKNMKMLNRLSDDQQKASTEAEPQADRAGDDTGGPRRVRTIPIAPGSGPPAAQAPPPSPTVPGIMLETRAPPPPRAAPPQPQQRVTLGQPPPPPAAVEDSRRVPVQAAPAPVRPQPQQQVQPQAQPPQPQAQPQQQAQPPLAKPAPPPPPPQQTASTGAGFVAVLSSQKTRMDALKLFADLQQQYGEALSGRTPDVQEADLSARGLGTMYRLVIGPPGSRDAASGVCSRIKAAGHKDCWVMGY